MENNTKPILPVEIWGGVECTVNRVGDHYSDQLIRSGHQHRLDDLNRFASLGIQTLRYPVLWERTAPNSLDAPDWQWSDERLQRLKELHIYPIVGLAHHSSGPHYASIDSDRFSENLARYAGMVAERYPWVEMYTPVNEPLTTARFCALYGHWYPHHKDNLSFLRLLLNECKGTVLAMQAIRKVQPAAKLVQTEDMGQIHCTPELAYQAEFENQRRWLSFDLLCGKVTNEHWLWGHLIQAGITEQELSFFWENSCPPDIIGINYYLTSERFLDHRLNYYPSKLHGGNGRHAYVDTEAIRIPEIEIAGIYSILKQVWERYNIPIAITEAHLGCTREDQMRWFHQVWQAATQLKNEGVDVLAVTAWAMLGSFDWDSLVVHSRGYYEPALFDLRAPTPRPTGLARLITQIREEGQATHPILAGEGWWQRNDRWTIQVNFPQHICSESHTEAKGRPIVITGATGTLGQAFAKICERRGIAYQLLKRSDLDITNPVQINQVIQHLQPWAIINTAGYVKAAQAENEPDICYRANLQGPLVLAEACRQHNVQLVTFSSDLVFDGQKGSLYIESDSVHPQSVYGASKAAAEQQVLALLPSALVIRTSAFFGPWDEHNFAIMALRNLMTVQSLEAPAHVEVSPTFVPDLVQASLDLLLDGAEGIWHLATKGQISWAGFARLLALEAGAEPSVIEDWYQTQEEASAGKATQSTALGSEKSYLMPSLEDAIRRYLHDCTFIPKMRRGKAYNHVAFK